MVVAWAHCAESALSLAFGASWQLHCSRVTAPPHTASNGSAVNEHTW